MIERYNLFNEEVDITAGEIAEVLSNCSDVKTVIASLAYYVGNAAAISYKKGKEHGLDIEKDCRSLINDLKECCLLVFENEIK